MMAQSNNPPPPQITTAADPEFDESRTVTYGIVNGVFIWKAPITMTVYPEIVDQIKKTCSYFGVCL